MFGSVAAHRVCVTCDDDWKNKPIVGLGAIHGLKPEGYWGGGGIIDPQSGSIHCVPVRLMKDGR